MNIALIQPAGATHDLHRLRNQLIDLLSAELSFFADQMDHMERFPSLALLTLAGLLPAEANLTLIDEESAGPDFTRQTLTTGSFDLALVSVMNHQAARAREIGTMLKELGIPSVCGGYYPSAAPERLTESFDSIVSGEAEDTLPRLLNDFSRGNLSPRYISTGGNPAEKFPLPRYDLLTDPALYSHMPLQASRGCIHECTFCTISSLYGRGFRIKDPHRVVEEISRIREVAPRHPLYFCDENLCLDRSWARKLTHALMPLRITFEAYADISIGDDPQLLHCLRQAGCRQLQIGLESLDPQTLAEVSPWKASLLPRYPDLISRIQDAGIEVIGMFIAGFDRDTPDTFKRLNEFIEGTNLYNFNLEWLTPVPGTKIYEKLSAAGRIIEGAWEEEETISFIPAQITPAALQWGSIWLSWQFHQPNRTATRRKYFKSIHRRLLDLSQYPKYFPKS